jgi:chromosome segregation ATPase
LFSSFRQTFSRISSQNKKRTSAPPLCQEKVKKKKVKTNNIDDCLENVQKKTSSDRRKHAFASGLAEGIAQGRAEAQQAAYEKGLEQGKKIGRAISQAVNDALQTRVQELQDELTGRSTRVQELQDALIGRSTLQYEATSTATNLIVKCRQQENLIEAQERNQAELGRNLANEQQRSAELQRSVNHLQEQLLEARRVAAAGAPQSARQRPNSSVYLNLRA